MNKRNIALISAAIITIGTGSIILAAQPKEEAFIFKPTTGNDPVSQNVSPAPVSNETIQPDTVTEAPVASSNIPVAPTTTEPTQPAQPAARSYDELVAYYGFGGEINTNSLTMLKTMYPERFTPDTIEHTFKYLRNIGSSIDYRYVRTYGWDLPQYQ